MFFDDDLTREIRRGINNGFSIGLSGKDKVALADLANLKATMDPDNAQNILASAAREINSGMRGRMQRDALMRLGSGVAGLNPQARKSAGLDPLEGYQNGGFLKGPVNPATGDDMFAYEPATGKMVGFKRGEYVLDDDIVRFIGVQNLDNMVEKTRAAMEKGKTKGVEGYADGGYIKPKEDTMAQRLASSPAAKTADWVGRAAYFAGGALPTLAMDAANHVANTANKFLGGSSDYFPTDNFGKHLERTQPDRFGGTTMFQGGGAAPNPVKPATPAAKPVAVPPKTPKQVGRQVAKSGVRAALPAKTGGAVLPPVQNVAMPDVVEPPWGGEGVSTAAYMMDDKGVQAARVGADGKYYNETISPEERNKIDWSLDPAGAAKVAVSYGGVEGAYGDPTLKDRALRFNTAMKNAGIEPGNSPAERAAWRHMRLGLQQDQTNAQKYADDATLNKEKLAEEKRQANMGNALGWYQAKTGRMNAGRSATTDPIEAKIIADALKDTKNPVAAMDGIRTAIGLYRGTHSPIASNPFALGGKQVRLSGAVHSKDYNNYQGLTKELADITQKYKDTGWFRNKKAETALEKQRARIFSDMKRLGVSVVPIDDNI